MTQVINKEVFVNSFYFTGKGMKTFPRQMEIDGRFVTFGEPGLHYSVKRGGETVRLFDVSDGATTYRLRQEGSCWTLVGAL